MKASLKIIAKEIHNAKKIAIFTHKNPDLDALGSSLSLYYACRQLGKEVDIYLKDEILPRKVKLIQENPIQKDFIDKQYDLFISTDTSTPNLLGDFKDIFLNGRKKIVLDHHSSDLLQGDFTYRNKNFSSCSEVVYKLIKELKIEFNSKLASLVFIGLTGDTNSFLNTNTNVNSFYVAYKCVKTGANITFINNVEYKSKTLKDIELEKYLLNNLKIDDNIAYCLVSLKTLQKYNAIKDDCDYFSSKLLNVDGVDISFSLIEQTPNYYSLSMRGKYGFNVKDIAEKFGGGGHISAAGAKIIANNIEKLKDEIVNECKKQCEIK